MTFPPTQPRDLIPDSECVGDKFPCNPLKAHSTMSQENPTRPLSKLPAVLITGAFSGLGRAFFQHFTRRSDETCDQDEAFQVIGLDRRPWTDEDGSTGHSHPHSRRSTYVQLDVTSPVEDLEAFARRWVGEETPIHLLIHCAGVRGLVPGVEMNKPDDVATAETLDAMDAATMMKTFEINVIGTFNILTAALPNLRLATARGGLKPRVVIMSSRMGSVAANDKGGGYAYRASKAGLNAVVSSMCIDVPEVLFALVHPGRVETGLVSVKEDGAMSCEESLGTILPLIDMLGEGHLKSGCFVDRFGTEIPW